MTNSTPSGSQASSTSLGARPRYDAIVIGGGVNGLACATLLAKNGIHTLLLEQRAELGGCASEGEIAAGFKVPMLAHATGPVRRDVVEELQLYLHDLAFNDAPLHVSTLSQDGRPLVVYGEARQTSESLRSWSEKDAARWPHFQGSLQRLGGLIGSLFMSTPPSVDSPSGRDVFALMHTLSDFRALPKGDQWRLLRWGPMAVADLVAESIDTELLRAAVAADGIFGAMLGPWSAGSGLQLLLTMANQSVAWPAGRVRLAPDLDYLERAFDHAKYGRFSTDPWIEFTIPSLEDPNLAPPGAHVLSAYAQFAPYTLRERGWDDSRDALGDAVIKTLSRYAPDLPSLIVERQVLTPLDLERGWGLTGGHIFHGELSLDQFFTMRPLLGFGQYRTPIAGLFLCGSGTHPGTGLTGGSGMNAGRAVLRSF